MLGLGIETIYGEDGVHPTPYMTRVKVGRLRLHIFHRGDADPDLHDHPWPFWTLPLTSYIEEVLEHPDVSRYPLRVKRIVKAFRFHHRPATYAHRVLGRLGYRLGPDDRRHPYVKPGRIYTLVLHGRKPKDGWRKWGFHRFEPEGRVCWIPWRKYVYEGGKHAPCEEINQ